MIKNIMDKYEKGKSKRIKLIALCLKAITGVLGASMILTEQRPYLTLLVLCVGAVANEIINFISEEEREESIPKPGDNNPPAPLP